MTLLWPVIAIYINHRKKIGKEHIERFNERIGEYKTRRPKGDLIWFHAASVGESISIINLVEDLAHEYNILITSGTLTSAKIIESRKPLNTIHQFVPIDRKKYVRKFLNHFKPNLAFFVESEIWPNLLHESKKQNIPVILGSARITPKSNFKIKLQQSFFKFFIKYIDIIIPQNQFTYDFYRPITNHKKLCNINNLKLGSNALPYEEKAYKELLAQTQSRIIFLAASTHDNEEELILACHKALKQTYPEILTIISPRHPNRRDKIIEVIKNNKLNFSVRSKNEVITEATEIYLADTIGEMGLFFKLSPISFIGGSLVNVGGHNILEPIQYQSIVIIGKYNQNFVDLIKEFEAKNAITIVENENDLTNKISNLLNNPKQQEIQIKNQNQILKQFSEIRQFYLEKIKSKLH
ncbi:MAG: 3-deoxy-D-manno-octulosonic acid transferase [Rickettsiales bacterium]|nr:3-deoxy-D-manno-octulosonic acid transferase [Rickettsiales bacterium]